MSPTAVVPLVVTAAAFPLLLWAIGRTVTAMGERAPYSRSRHYLAGRLDGVRITALIDGGDELLVNLTAPATNAPLAAAGPLAQVFRVQPANAPWTGSAIGETRPPSCAPTCGATRRIPCLPTTDKDEVGGSSPPRPTSRGPDQCGPMISL
jgi:hypothetical protein